MPRAKWWLEQAAEQGYFPAQYNLAGMYLSGVGVEDEFIAIDLMMEPLSDRLSFPDQLGEDELIAIELMEQMAEQGHAPAQYRLALMYLSGLGGEKDMYQFKERLEQAAEQGYALAQLVLSLYIGLLQERRRGYVLRARERLEKAPE